MGRCHLVKMMGFSRLLYLMQTLPLLIKHSDSKTLNSKFLWARKRPRIALNKLIMARDEGGVNFPNLRCYNLCLTHHVLDWLHRESYFSNWDLEMELAAPWPLTSLLLTRLVDIPTQIKRSVTLRHYHSMEGG